MTSKILIITELMMPYAQNWGACQRIYHYAKKMVAEGIRVTVICHNVSNRVDGTEDIDGIKVIGRGGKKNPASTSERSGSCFKSELRKRLQAIDRNTKLISGIVRSTYRFIYSEPNTLSGRTAKQWANSVLPYVLEYIKDEGIDTVILSGPTFGFFYHAEEIKMIGVKLILDYRDPWISWYEKPTLASGAERKAIEYSDLVVTTTETLTEELNKKYDTNKCHTVMNGYDNEQWEKIQIPLYNKTEFKIAYVGTIRINGTGGFRDVTCFLNAMEVFQKMHKDVQIRFVGVMDDLDTIPDKWKKFAQFENSIPVDEALVITAASDVLLVLHTAHNPSGKYIISGKVFDCMRSGNYMLSIGDVAYANKEFVEKTESGIHCDNNQEAILEALETLYEKWEKGGLIKRKRDTEQYSRDYQNTEFLRLIKAL